MNSLVQSDLVQNQKDEFKSLVLQNANNNDFQYFYHVRKITMTEHFVRAGKQWNDEEIDRHKASFDIDALKIILADGRRVGFLKLLFDETTIALSHFCIEPEYQGNGLGSRVMKKVMEIAQARNLKVELNVLIGNRASNVYERLGFICLTGPDPLLKYYVWTPL